MKKQLHNFNAENHKKILISFDHIAFHCFKRIILISVAESSWNVVPGNGISGHTTTGFVKATSTIAHTVLLYRHKRREIKILIELKNINTFSPFRDKHREYRRNNITPVKYHEDNINIITFEGYGEFSFKSNDFSMYKTIRQAKYFQVYFKDKLRFPLSR